MGRLRWYQRDPNAALAGMMILSLEERGAYNTLLDLIYAHDGRVLDDERFLCGAMRCNLKVWKRIRGRLLELGKVYLDADGFLRNLRADVEVSRGLNRVASAEQAGRKSGATRRELADKTDATISQHDGKMNGAVSANNGLGGTDVANSRRTTKNLELELDGESKNQEKKERETAQAPSRAHRIPPDWTLSPELREYAKSKGLTDQQTDRQAERFKNFWTAKSGKDAAKIDWPATWRNWVLTAIERGAGGRASGPGGPWDRGI